MAENADGAFCQNPAKLEYRKSESETTGTKRTTCRVELCFIPIMRRAPHADSKFRSLNCTPTNKQVHSKYFIDKSNGGYEFLLANDFDNSNPHQAEQLNWLHP